MLWRVPPALHPRLSRGSRRPKPALRRAAGNAYGRTRAARTRPTDSSACHLDALRGPDDETRPVRTFEISAPKRVHVELVAAEVELRDRGRLEAACGVARRSDGHRPYRSSAVPQLHLEQRQADDRELDVLHQEFVHPVAVDVRRGERRAAVVALERSVRAVGDAVAVEVDCQDLHSVAWLRTGGVAGLR